MYFEVHCIIIVVIMPTHKNNVVGVGERMEAARDTFLLSLGRHVPSKTDNALKYIVHCMAVRVDPFLVVIFDGICHSAAVFPCHPFGKQSKSEIEGICTLLFP